MRLSALVLLPAVAAHARPPACTPTATSLHLSNDACIQAHVYDVITVPGGTRFLDLCSPDVPDASCRISIVSYPRDSGQVGDLATYRDKDIIIRGAIRQFDGRYVVVLNDARQFHGQPARFTPDPRLVHGPSSEEGPDSDAPELRVNFHHHGRKLEKE